MALGGGTLDGAPLGSNDQPSAPPAGADAHGGRLNGNDAPLT